MKRIISLILASFITMSSGIAVSFASEEKNDVVFAEDLMEYTGNQPLMNNPCNGGVGFSDKWEPGVGGFDGYVPRTRADKGTMWIAMYSRFTCDTLKRSFSEPIKTNENYDYFISVNYGWNIVDKETKGRIFLSTRENSAEDYISAGFEYKDDGVYPYALVGGNKVYGKNKVTSPYNHLKMHINISEDGTVKLEVKNYGWDEQEPLSYDAVSVGKLGALSLTHFKFDSEILSASTLRWGYLGSVTIEKYESDKYENAAYITDVFNRIKSDDKPSAEECSEVIIRLSDGIDYMGIDPVRDYKDILLPYLEENKMTDAMPGFQIESLSINPEKVVFPEDTSEITAILNIPVYSEDVKVLSGEEAVDCEVKVEGKKVIIKFSERLEQGKSYTVTFSDVSDFRGLTLEDVTFVTSLIPMLSVEDNGKYSEGTKLVWNDIPGVDIKINDGEIENGHIFDIPGEYTLKITAEKDGIKDEREIKIVITEAFRPVAENVKITGKAATGELLKGSYEFYDQNGDVQGESKFRWLKSSSENGVYEEIEGETDNLYTLREEDENMYIKFAVIPVSESTVKAEGEEYLSESFTGAFKPEVKNVTLKGEVAVGEKITVAYDFSDKNNDKEDESHIKWYISSEEDGEYKVIEDVSGAELTVLEEYADKFIKASVLPIASSAPFEGDEIFSGKLAMPKKPQALSVKVEGTAVVGKTLSASYIYFDENNDEEAGKEIIWEDSSGNVLGKEAALKLTSQMAGKSIRVGVKVKSVRFPFEGDIKYSEYVAVKKKSQSSGGGGGGGSMAMTGSNSGSISKEPAPKPQQPQPDIKTEKFSDISSHWAKAEIEKIADAGFVNGFPDGTFKPDDKTTFIQFLVMALRGAGLEESEYSGELEGVTNEDWFAGFLQTAIDNGFLEGYETAQLNGEIKREDVAVLTDRILGLENSEKELTFEDLADIPAAKAEAVRKIYNAGIMNGYTDNTFKPANNLTRAEAVVIISRVKGSEEVKDEN